MTKVNLIAFTKYGVNTALKISKNLSGVVWTTEKFQTKETKVIELKNKKLLASLFSDSDTLIFVCACGIAVRTIAPLIQDKTKDPAVLVTDDMGKHVISLLSGHIGGANDMANRVAQITGGTAVITTATDIHNVTAVDKWAIDNDCAIENIKEAKEISSEVLNGYRVGVAITEKDIPTPFPVTLWLRPKNLILGVGCKKNTEPEYMRNSFENFMRNEGLSPLSIKAITSISLKQGEKAIISLAEYLNVPFVTYSAEELAQVKGIFTTSERVKSVTGVDNVCERSAARYSQGEIIVHKTLYKGITFALAKIRR